MKIFNTYSNYIFKRLLVIFTITMATSLPIIWSMQALRRFDMITEKGQTSWLFLKMTSMTLPHLAGILAPFALFISITILVTRMIADSEMPVLFSGGVSPWRIFRPFLFFSFLVTLMTMLLIIWFGPYGLQNLRHNIIKLQVSLVTNLAKPGQFIEIDEGLTFHINDRLSNGGFENILLHDKRNPPIEITYIAQQGEIVKIADSVLLVLHNGTIQNYNHQSDNITLIHFEDYAFSLIKIQESTKKVRLLSYELSPKDLVKIINDKKITTKRKNKLQKELHDRISQSFTPLVYFFLLYNFLSKARNYRQSRSQMIITSIAVCILFRIILFLIVSQISGDSRFIVITYASMVLVPILIAGIYNTIQRYKT